MSEAPAGVMGGTVQIPRLRIKAGGIPVPRPVEARVNLTNTWTAATWSASIVLNDADQMNAAWWSDQSDVRIEIDYALDGATYVTQLLGVTDEIDLQPEGNFLTLTGRDLTALLIDVKTAESYQNQTSSEISTLLAQSVGLGTSHIVATTTPVGEYYAGDAVRMSMGDLAHSITNWDLLIYLAQQESFDVFVEGSDLYFQPMANSAATPFQVTFQRIGGIATSNVMNLAMKRALTLAKDVSVTVKSFNSLQGKAITATTKSSARGPADGAPQNYVFYKPNLTPAEAQNLANQRLAEITRHERIITFDCPPELTLTPRGVVRLSGTGTAFDQLYYPDGIARALSQHGGSQSVTARNHSAVDQVALASGTPSAASGLDYSAPQ